MSVAAYTTAPLDDPRTPWRAARFVVVDLETTGLDPGEDEIIAFASLAVDAGRVRMASQRLFLVRPERSAPPESVRIHGLREADLADAPPMAAVLGDLLDALAGRTLVAHAAWVEQGFLRSALGRAGVELRGPVVDTMALAATVLGADPRIGLTALAERLSLPVHRPHHADGDALTTAQVFLALATRLEAAGRGTLADLAEPAGARRRRPWRLRR
jgi:DNA polymerase III subunit epsilon